MSLRARIALQTAVLAFILLVVALAAVYNSTSRESDRSMTQRAHTITGFAGKVLSETLIRKRGSADANVQMTFDQIFEGEPDLLAVRVYDLDDTLVAKTGDDRRGRRFSEAVLIGGRKYGRAEIFFDTESAQARARNSLLRLAFLFLATAVIGTAAAIVLARRITRPVARLSAASARLASGEPGARAVVESEDEIGELGRQFNLMAEAIERANAILKDDLENLGRLHHATGALAAILDPMELQSRICEEFAHLGRASTVVFWLRPSVEEDLLVATCAKGLALPADPPRRAFGESVAGRVASRGRAERILDISSDPDFRPLPGAPTSGPKIVLPLSIQGRVLGVVSLAGGRGNAFTDREEGILVALAEFCAIALQNAENYNRAIRDSLTNLYVKRYFEDRLRGEFSRFRRYGSPLSLLMMDLDKFKSINDNYGHPVGDKVLIHFAKIVERIVRAGTDVAARYGGEEFAVILVETDEAGARIVAERLRKAVEDYTFEGPNGRLPVTISIGAASARTGLPVEELVHEADQALYHSKHEGRNRAFHYQDIQG